VKPAVVVGGLAVGYHGRPRATVDVDLLLPRSVLERVARALEAASYAVREHGDVVRVYPAGSDPASGEAIADLVAREANPVLRAAFDAAEDATVLGHRVRVVRRGALVALKFHAAISPHRRIEDRYQDIADLGRVVTRGFDAEDAELARTIAAKMYPGAEDELDGVIDDLRHGRPVKL